MCGRRLRTKLDLLRPDRKVKVRQAQQKQQQTSSASGSRNLRPGVDVWLRQYRRNDKWVQGKVTEKLGATDYKVVDAMGRQSHKHVDQLKLRKRSSLFTPSSPASSPQEPADTGEGPVPSGTVAEPSEVITVEDQGDGQDLFEDSEEQSTPELTPSSPGLPAPEPTRSRPMRRCRLNKVPMNTD